MQWWEHRPPAYVVRGLNPSVDTIKFVSWVCHWFSSLLLEVFLWVLRFSSLLRNQYFQIPIWPGTTMWICYHLIINIIISISSSSSSGIVFPNQSTSVGAFLWGTSSLKCLWGLIWLNDGKWYISIVNNFVVVHSTTLASLRGLYSNNLKLTK